MEKYIIIALILLFGVIYYFDDGKKELTVSDLEKISNQHLNEDRSPKRSWTKLITNAIKDKNRPDDGIRRVGSNKPDSDTSACVGWPKSDKDMIVTKFAGYVLKYPCTVNQKGEYHIEYNPNGTILSQRYRLKIAVKTGSNNDSIAFPIQLTSNAKRVNFKHDLDSDSSYEKIMDIDTKNLIVYYKKNNGSSSAIASIKNQLDANGFNPIVSCYPGLHSPYKLFSPLNDVGVKLNCNAYWSLTKDIKVRIVHFDSKYAYHFSEIYQVINKNLQEMIIEKPNTPLKPSEN